MTEEQHTLSVRQVALRTGFTLKYIRDLLYAGKLPGAGKQEGRWAIPVAAIKARWPKKEDAE